MTHTCLACGYPGLEHPPRTKEGGGSYEICPCCGYQYGVDDEDRGIPPETWRARWVAAGRQWWSAGIPRPPGWDPEAQLRRLTDPQHPSPGSRND